MKIIFTPITELPYFKSRKLRKDNPNFLQDYNLTVFSWSIIRIKVDKIVDENIGKILLPNDTLSIDINNATILTELKKGVEIISSQTKDKDYLKIEESFAYDSIKNLPRKAALGYLSFQYCNKIWTPETGYQFYEEIELIDKGDIVLSE